MRKKQVKRETRVAKISSRKRNGRQKATELSVGATTKDVRMLRMLHYHFYPIIHGGIIRPPFHVKTVECPNEKFL